MTRKLILVGVVGTGLLALAAAAPPSSLAQVQPGLWEIQGVPEVAGVIRQCVADISVLARFEHRSRNCNMRTSRDAGNVTQIDYSCGQAEFGHSDVSVVTPRALRIATQGISGGLPFNYVLQARRVGECTAARH